MNFTTHEQSTFGEMLKAFRRQRQFTQQQLAAAIGVNRGTIIRWEQGDGLPATKALVLEIARHLNLKDQVARHLLEASLIAPVPHWLVPLPRNPVFTGRDDLLETIHMRLQVDQNIAKSYAIHGLGGVGKTQLALEYAYRHALEYSAIFWLEAETADSLIGSFLQIAGHLRLPECANVDQQRQVAAVQRWLVLHSQWLLIWDNLDEIDLLHHWLPLVRHGSHLVTSRCQALGPLVQGLELAPMEREEGMLLVLRRAKRLEAVSAGDPLRHFANAYPAEAMSSEQLVRVLGGLPLALDQAGAYLEETGCSVAGYLARYTQHHQQLLERRGTRSWEHPHSVVATLWLACQQVVQRHPAALELLRCCAMVAPDAIPEELLAQGANHLGPVLGPVASDPLQLDAVLAAVRQFSLVQRHPDTATLSLHRLVQVVLQDGMSQQEQAQWQQRVILAFRAILPEVALDADGKIWRQYERLLPHVLACADAISDQAADHHLADVLRKVADYMRVHAQFLQAESLYRRALHIQESAGVTVHLDMAASLKGLAILSLEQGKYAQAEPLFQQTYQIVELALGPDHPQVATALNNLAIIAYRQGHYQQAESLYQRALRITEQSLGSDHPQVARALNNLAILYREQGKYRESEAHYHRALEIYEQVLGLEHPQVASSLNNLAVLYSEQNNDERAEALCLRALHIQERLLGPEHPLAASPLGTLADIYHKQGKDDKAAPLYHRALHIMEQSLGSDQPPLISPLAGLADLSSGQQNFAEADMLYTRALTICEQYLGPHHPETAQILHSIACLHQRQGHLQAALSFAERAFAIRAESLGRTHPKTVATQTLIEHVRAEQNESEQCKTIEGSTSIILGNEQCQKGTDPADSSTQGLSVTPLTDSDPLQGFLMKCCELHPRAWCRSAELWQAYIRWAASQQERYPLTRGAFIIQLKEHGCRAERIPTARIWRGIRLAHQFDDGE